MRDATELSPPGYAWLSFARKSVRSPFLSVGIGNVSGLLLGLISGILAARILGPTLRGEFVVVQTWAGTIALILTLGMTQAVVTFPGSDREITGPLILQGIAAGTIGLGFLVCLAFSGAQPWIRPAGVIGGAALTAGTLTMSNAAGVAQRHGNMKRGFQIVRLAPQALVVVTLLFLWAGHVRDSNTWLLAVGIAILVPAFSSLIVQLGGVKEFLGPKIWLPSRLLVRHARSGFVVVLGSSVVYRLDVIMVAAWLKPEKVALYAVATAIGAACAAVGQTVGMLTFSRLRNIANPAAQWALIRLGTFRALAVSAAVAIPIFAVTPYAIRIFYGSDFVPATAAARYLVLAAIPLSADYLLVHALLSLGMGKKAFRIQIFAGLATLGLLALTIPSGHIGNVALVSVGVYSVSAAFLFFNAKNISSGHAPDSPEALLDLSGQPT